MVFSTLSTVWLEARIVPASGHRDPPVGQDQRLAVQGLVFEHRHREGVPRLDPIAGGLGESHWRSQHQGQEGQENLSHRRLVTIFYTLGPLDHDGTEGKRQNAEPAASDGDSSPAA